MWEGLNDQPWQQTPGPKAFTSSKRSYASLFLFIPSSATLTKFNNLALMEICNVTQSLHADCVPRSWHMRVIQGTHGYSISNWMRKALTTICVCWLIVSVLFELVMIRSPSTNWSIFKPTLLLKCWLEYPYMPSQDPKDVINGYT